MAAAELEAAKNSWQVAITILDSGGNMIMFHRVDNAQLSATTVSEGKARTSLEFKRPSKALDDAIAAGGAGMRLLALKDITPYTIPVEEFEKKRHYFAANAIGGYPYVGTPDRVADELANISKSGMRGIAVSFVNYLNELPYFCDEVLPRLARLGVRETP